MKNILAYVLTLVVINAAQAATYKVEVITAEGSDISISTSGTKTDSKMGYYNFFCKGECEGVVAEMLNAKPGEMYKNRPKLKSISNQQSEDVAKEHGLRYDKMDKFISETGQEYSITDLILQYEKLILSQAKNKLNGVITGRENSDIIYRLTKTDDKYTIEIFTADDAKNLASILE